MPVGIMVIILIDIFVVVRVRKRAVIHPTATNSNNHKKSHQHRHLQLQMFVLMIASIAIFLITTLPLAIYKITSPREKDISSSIVRIISIWVGLGWFQSLNYAVCKMIIYLTALFVRLLVFVSIGQLLCSLSVFDIISSRIFSTNSIFLWRSTS